MAGNSDKGGQAQDEGTDEKQNKHQQIVIVRDKKIQHDLQTKLGNGSLVFTILQSKGMEYDDVFLFDFFSSSPCLSSYRSLEELLDDGANPSYGAIHMVCFEISASHVNFKYYVYLLTMENRLCARS